MMNRRGRKGKMEETRGKSEGGRREKKKKERGGEDGNKEKERLVVLLSVVPVTIKRK